MSEVAPSQPHLRIHAARRKFTLDLPEIWRARHLLMALATRDVKLRYRQTALGVGWVLVQPLLAAGIFAVLFGVVAKLPTNGLPAFVFSYAGMLAWGLLSNTISKSSISLVGNAQLISKVYFPRMVLPLSTVLSVLIDFAVCSIVMIAMLAIYRIAPPAQIILLPVWVALILALALAFGLYAASLTVSYRDVQYLVPVLLQMMLLASPVGYAVPRSPAWVHTLFVLNPMTGLLEAVRWSLFGSRVQWWAVAYSSLFALGAFAIALYAFRRMERRFADVI